MRRAPASAEPAPTARRWGEAGAISISATAIRAERLLKVDFTVAEKAAPLAREAADRTALDILRNAARSMIAQANVERQGAVSLLLD